MGRIVSEVPLVEYYEKYQAALLAEGFRILLLALVRDADLPSFYDDIERYWDSLDDLTGPHVVFAVAGAHVAVDLKVDTLVERPVSRRHQPPAGWGNRGAVVNFNLASLSNRRRHRPNLEARSSIRQDNTMQVTELAEFLGLSESRLPCLHLTYLPAPINTRVVSLRGVTGFSIYTACKDMMEHFSRPLAELHLANHPTVPPTDLAKDLLTAIEQAEAEKATLAQQITDSRLRVTSIRQKLPTPREIDPTPEDLRVGVIVNSLRADIARGTYGAAAEAIDTFIEHLAYKRARPPREKLYRQQFALIQKHADAASQIATLDDLIQKGAVLPLTEDGLEAMRHMQADERRLLADIAAAEAHQLGLTHSIAQSRGHPELLRMADAQRQAIADGKSRIPSIERELLLSFQKFQTTPSLDVPSARPWDFFISYTSTDRSHALAIFKTLNRIGRTFIDFICLAPGEHWRSKLQDIHTQSQTTIALITPQSKDETKAWYQVSEIEHAISLARTGKHRIIPVYLDQAAPWFGLEQLHAVFARTGSEAGEKLKSILV